MPEFVTIKVCDKAMKADHRAFGVIFVMIPLLMLAVFWSISAGARVMEKSHAVNEEASVRNAEQDGVTAGIEQSLEHIEKTLGQQHDEMKTQRSMIEDLWRERPSQ